DEVRALRIVLELLAQPEDMGVHRPRRRELVVPPYLVEQPIPGDHLAPVLHQVAQQVELLPREPHLLAGLEGLAAAQAHAHVAERTLLELLALPPPPHPPAD